MASTQKYRLTSISSPLGSDALLFKSMGGREALSRPFEFSVEVYSEDDHIDLTKIVGENVTVRVELPDEDGTRYFNGYVSDFAQSEVVGRYAVYQLTMRPWLWLLSHTADCRIFQAMTVPDILKQVFADHGFSDYELRLNGTYRSWEYCVQYCESDFDFVSRLMENEGIYYYFLHENGKHMLILADNYGAHEPKPGYEEIPFFPPGEDNWRERDHVYELKFRKAIQPGAFALNGWDFRVPKKNLRTTTEMPGDYAQGNYPYYKYGAEDAVYFDSGEGENYTRIRLEELQARHETVWGRANAHAIVPGALFTLIDYPRADYNKEYLVVSVEYEIRSDEFESKSDVENEKLYDCAFTVIDAQTPYRAPRVTPKPLIRGPQTAVVTGPSGEEIWVDEYGRVKCQFPWDRYSKGDDTSSCWVRVSQPWAGKRWGATFWPRVGHEVIVEFIEGDPDRPIVTGRVYNGDNMPPYELPSNKTRSGIKSNSSKGGQGFNELRFEDLKGEEQIFIHAERNEDIRVKNDAFEWIGNDRHLIVEKNQFEKVKENKHLIVDADQLESVGGDKHQTVTGDHNQKTDGAWSAKVAQDIDVKAGMNYALDAGMDIHLKAGMNVVVEAGASLTLKVGGNFININPAGVFIKGTMVMINSGGAAGSGKGASPDAPKNPQEAKEADNDQPGEIAEVKASPAVKPAAQVSANPVDAMQAAALTKAAASGAPFCEKCNTSF